MQITGQRMFQREQPGVCMTSLRNIKEALESRVSERGSRIVEDEVGMKKGTDHGKLWCRILIL